MRRGALLLALLLAGCAAPAASPPRPVAAPELVVDHDHAAAEGHDLAWGLEQVALVPASLLLGGEAARVSDVQFHGDLAAVTVNGGAGGFVLLDVADPDDVRVLSRYASGTADNWYTKFSPDGRFVVLTANAPGSPTARPTAGVRGLHVVDVTDPNAPRLASAWPWPVRVVNVATADLAGGTFVFASVVAEQLGVAGQNHVAVLSLDDAGRLAPVATWRPDAPEGKLVLLHDLAVEAHPVTGQALLYAAGWDAGAFLVDVTDPAAPREAGRWRPEGFPDAGLQVHTVKPHPGLVQGRHVAVASVETFGGEASGEHYLLDVTDPAAPALLARWSLPGGLVNDAPLLWSPHEFTLAEGKAFTSHFHGGAWVLDVANLTLAPLAAWAQAQPEGPATRWSVDAETAAWREGRLYVVDMGAGLVVLRPA